MFIYIYTYIHTYIHTYIYIYIYNTYTHTHHSMSPRALGGKTSKVQMSGARETSEVGISWRLGSVFGQSQPARACRRRAEARGACASLASGLCRLTDRSYYDVLQCTMNNVRMHVYVHIIHLCRFMRQREGEREREMYLYVDDLCVRLCL